MVKSNAENSAVKVVLLSSAFHELFDYMRTSRHEVVGVIGQGGLPPMNFVQKILNGLRSFFGLSTSLEFWCKKHNIPCTPYSDDSAFFQKVSGWKGDVLVVHFGVRVSDQLCQLFKYGGINLHPSKLPEYRGGSPLFWQAVDLVDDLSVSVHKITATYDQGDVLGAASAPRPEYGSERILSRQARLDLGGPLIVDILNDLEVRFTEAVPQPAKTTTRYARFVGHKNIKDHADFRQLSLQQSVNVLRYTEEWPVDLLMVSGVFRLLVWRAVKYIEAESAGCADKDAGCLTLKRRGLRFYADHRDGLIEFSPAFRPGFFVRRLKQLLRGD